MNQPLNRENQDWLERFCTKHGRKPKILHIGNIANNAYNNARILNEAGLDCDVICYDYYHIMGCPEWEDGDFVGQIKDDFRPNWSKIDLHEFTRPEWFAQGPLEMCMNYLLARRSGNKSQQRLWQELQIASLCKPPTSMDSLISLRLVIIWLKPAIRRIIINPVSNIARTIRRSIPYRILRKAKRWTDSLTALRIIQSHISKIVFPQNRDSNQENNASLELTKRFADEFPNRSDQLIIADFQQYLPLRKKWQNLLAHYDYVIAYSTDPIHALIAKKPYFAFEHGTIREIPYHSSAQGRLTALAYRLAQHVFVTNFDCLKSAETLSPSRFTLINHPYDEDHGLKVSDWKETRAKLLSKLDSNFLFFHPTRHDWVEGTGYADKSNDIFLRAFASLRQKGLKVGLVCCCWGANVAESKKLIQEKQCSAFVDWISPLAITPFERMCLATDIVVDQFKLGAFGGVVFKAMAVGTPILTYLHEKRLLKQYPECPPVVNCRTEADIVAQVQILMQTPDRLRNLGDASRTWIKRYHAKENTVNAQVTQMRLFEPV